MDKGIWPLSLHFLEQQRVPQGRKDDGREILTLASPFQEPLLQVKKQNIIVYFSKMPGPGLPVWCEGEMCQEDLDHVNLKVNKEGEGEAFGELKLLTMWA